MDIKDSELIYRALLIWSNHIETGSVSLSADDAKRSNKAELIRQLSPDQVSFVSRLKDLAGQQLSALTEPKNFQGRKTGLRVKPVVPSRPRRR